MVEWGGLFSQFHSSQKLFPHLQVYIIASVKELSVKSKLNQWFTYGITHKNEFFSNIPQYQTITCCMQDGESNSFPTGIRKGHVLILINIWSAEIYFRWINYKFWVGYFHVRYRNTNKALMNGRRPLSGHFLDTTSGWGDGGHDVV